ncbi:transposase family protein [Streptomyces sp. NPDC005483]|uniref:transposase family protein n=1 Tax=Streptomyces sp. NPDC005483 TaxID=3154882 RepID=UPI0033ACB0A0
MCGSGGLGRLLPHLSGVVVESIERAAGTVTFCAHSAVPTARCPRCGVVSWRVHGRYARRLADAPVGGAPAVVELVVRRFKCLNPQCLAVTFAEQIEGLTSPHARYTPLLLTSIASCLAGRPGGAARGGAEHPRRQGQAPGTAPWITGVTAGQRARPRGRRLRATQGRLVRHHPGGPGRTAPGRCSGAAGAAVEAGDGAAGAAVGS